MMGARIPDNNFTAIDLLRELECARENLENKHVNVVDALILFIENNVGEMRNKRKSKKRKGLLWFYRPTTRSQKAENKEKDKSAQLPGRAV
jgi:hypothetical protein